jgi:hypothetical protein
MTDHEGNLTGVDEISSAIPGVPFPYSLNLGAEYHVGAKTYTLDIFSFGGKQNQ